MDELEAMKARHAVRAFSDREIDAEAAGTLGDEIKRVNEKTGLHIQLVLNEPGAFHADKAHYGNFSGVRNYIALVGKKASGTEERLGYWGEHLVILAQMLGLNSCWVGMTFSKIPGAFTVADGETLLCVIALGYGTTQGAAHPVKRADKVIAKDSERPDWFMRGIEAALLAPTALNQQKFTFRLKDGTVSAKPGIGFFVRCDLGIAKYHFEKAAGAERFTWSE